MAAYRQVVDKLGGHFAGYSVEWIDRRKNEEADTLSRIGSARLAPPAGVFLHTITKPSVSPPREIDIGVPLQPEAALVALITEPDDWTRLYVAYLEAGTLPADETDAWMIARRCKSFTIIDGELHKCSVTGVFQRCVQPAEGRKILHDIHSGDCGHHVGARSLVAKAMQHGFYWPTAHADAVNIVQRCAGCQKYANQTHVPSSALETIPITWPFAVWGHEYGRPLQEG